MEKDIIFKHVRTICEDNIHILPTICIVLSMVDTKERDAKLHLFTTHIEVELEHLYIPFLVYLLVGLVMEWETWLALRLEVTSMSSTNSSIIVLLVAKTTF